MNNKREVQKKVRLIVENISSMNKTIESLGEIPEVVNKKVKAFGNGCHVVLPKQFLNKKARVVIT